MKKNYNQDKNNEKMKKMQVLKVDESDEKTINLLLKLKADGLNLNIERVRIVKLPKENKDEK